MNIYLTSIIRVLYYFKVVLFTLGARSFKIKTVDIYIAMALLINTLISVIAVIFNINKDNKERIIKNNYKAFLNQPST